MTYNNDDKIILDLQLQWFKLGQWIKIEYGYEDVEVKRFYVSAGTHFWLFFIWIFWFQQKYQYLFWNIAIDDSQGPDSRLMFFHFLSHRSLILKQ